MATPQDEDVRRCGKSVAAILINAADEDDEVTIGVFDNGDGDQVLV